MTKVIKTFDSIYSIDKKERIRVLDISVKSNEDSTCTIYYDNYILDHHDTSSIISTKDITEGKNIGKKNETSIEQQALLEAESFYNRKIKLGGKLNKEDLTNGSARPKPMLAKNFFDVIESRIKKAEKLSSDPMSYTIQLKLDGIRGFIEVKLLENGKLKFDARSRNNHCYNEQSKKLISELESSKEFTDWVKAHLKENQALYLDGEYYKFGENVNIQNIAEAMQTKEYDENIHGNLFYICYDVYIPHKDNLTYPQRFSSLSDVFVSYKNKSHIRILREEGSNPKDRYSINHVRSIYDINVAIGRELTLLSEERKLDFTKDISAKLEKIDSIHDFFVRNGFEGAMIRDINEPYKPNYRSKGLLKLKKFKDEEFEIIDIITPETGKDKGTAIFILKADDDKIFQAAPLGDFEQRKKFYDERDKLIGKSKKANVKFFEYTKDKIPRFPRVTSVRDYE